MREEPALSRRVAQLVAQLRADWGHPIGRLMYAGLPATPFALWALGRAGVVAAHPLWVWVGTMACGAVLTFLADFAFQRRRSTLRLHGRIAAQMAMTTVITYMNGWGPLLSMGYILIAQENITESGTRAWRPVAAWSLIAVAGGQAAIAVGLMPSLIPESKVQWLAAIAAFGVAFVIGILGLNQERVERAEASLRDSEERLRATIDTATDAYIELTVDGVITEWNAQAEAIFGWSREEAIGRIYANLVLSPSDDRGERLGQFRHMASTGEGMPSRVRQERLFHHRDGRVIPIEVAMWLTTSRSGPRVSALVRDISERRDAERALRESEESFRLLFQRHPHPMWLYDQETLRFVRVNDAAIEQYGYTRDEFFAMTITDVRPEGDAPPPGEPPTGLVRHVKKSGDVIDVELSSYRLEVGGRHHTLVMAQDVTDRLRAQRALVHQAMHDALTGLPNRKVLVDHLQRALGDPGDGVALIFIDLDRFKVVNDGKGHATGDRLLIEVAARMRRAVRPGDLVARIGGDEFVVVLDGVADREQAHAASARIAWALDAPFRVEGSELFVSASQGIALAEPGDTADDLLSRADTAMYTAKDRGRARSEFAEPAARQAALTRLELHADMHRALAGDELALYYQPIVSIPTGRPVAVEALVRWRHPERGMLRPLAFLSVAEESGLMGALDEWVLHRALDETGGWETTLSVNVGVAPLTDPGFATSVGRSLDAWNVHPSRLQIDVPELAILRDADRAAAAVTALREIGVRVAVDDFGTTHASFAHVERLPVNALKIDASLVSRVDESSRDAAVVASVVELGRGLGSDVIAEGVETDRQRKVLDELGCRLAQGFWFASPMPGRECAELLDSTRAGDPGSGA